jgi:hypothetical protein
MLTVNAASALLPVLCVSLIVVWAAIFTDTTED